MSARQARFEIVRTDAEQPWRARFRAANGRIVFTSETYTRRGRAVGAIRSLTTNEPTLMQSGITAVFTEGRYIEVREVDERESPR